MIRGYSDPYILTLGSVSYVYIRNILWHAYIYYRIMVCALSDFSYLTTAIDWLELWHVYILRVDGDVDVGDLLGTVTDLRSVYIGAVGTNGRAIIRDMRTVAGSIEGTVWLTSGYKVVGSSLCVDLYDYYDGVAATVVATGSAWSIISPSGGRHRRSCGPWPSPITPYTAIEVATNDQRGERNGEHVI